MADALIGRHAELQQVVEALKLARSGQATTVVIRGEPGIGKSRFLAEAIAQAELHGHAVLRAHLDDLDRYVPFAALRQAIEPALEEERDRELITIGEELESLSLPQLTAALERLLRAWADREPLVLAVDDLHAADTDTLTVLAQLIRHLHAEPITFMATMRLHPPDVSVDLASTMERLGRDELATVVDLPPLDRDDVRALVRSQVEATPDEPLVHLLAEATRGNPFYVQEGLRSLGDAGGLVMTEGRCRLAGDDPPAALRAQSTIVYRLFNLGPAARAVARALTAFRRFPLDDLPVLASLTELEPAEVDGAFDALVRGHLVTEVAGGYEFAHPIVRHTLYEDLGPAERRRVHATIAAHLTAARQAGREVQVPELAADVAASASPGDEDAVTILIEAGEATASNAPASAAAWYARALELLRSDDPRRGELEAERAKALFLASQVGAAAESASEAVGQLPPGRLRSRTAGLLVTSLTALGRFEEALEQSDAVLAMSDEPLARLHAERGALLVHLGRLSDAEAEADKALDLAADDQAARALGFRALSTVAHARGHVARSRELFEKQLDATDPLGPAARLSALTTQAIHLSLSGFVTETDQMLAEAASLSQDLGGAALHEALDVAATMNDWHAARWDEAMERLRWLAVPPSPGEAWVILARCAELAIVSARSDIARARAVAAELENAGFASSTALWARAVFHSMLGETDAAVELVDAGLAHNRASGRLADTHVLFEERVAIELDRGDLDAARKWAETMAGELADAEAPSAIATRDRCLTVTGIDPDGAGRALRLAQEHGMAFEAAHDRVALATLGIDSVENLQSAYETYKGLGAETLRRRTARVMKEAGVDVPRSRRVAKGELTETEIKLSRLVHDGLTNREIANVLIVSPKTVEVYLSRLFAKTGCESRVELAVAVSEGRLAQGD